jgi:hypothetical protein
VPAEAAARNRNKPKGGFSYLEWSPRCETVTAHQPARRCFGFLESRIRWLPLPGDVAPAQEWLQ